MLSRENKSLHNNSINEEHSTLNLLNNTIISPLTGRSTVEDNQRKVEAQSRSEQFARTTLPVPLSNTLEVLLKKFPEEDDVNSKQQTIHTGDSSSGTRQHDQERSTTTKTPTTTRIQNTQQHKINEDHRIAINDIQASKHINKDRIQNLRKTISNVGDNEEVVESEVVKKDLIVGSLSQSLGQDSLISGSRQGFDPSEVSPKNCDGILATELSPNSPLSVSPSKSDPPPPKSINKRNNTMSMPENSISRGKSTVEDNQRKGELQSRSEQLVARATLPVPPSTPEVLLKKFPEDNDDKSKRHTTKTKTGNNKYRGNNNTNLEKHDTRANNNNTYNRYGTTKD